MDSVNQSCIPTGLVLSGSSLVSAWLIVEVPSTALVALDPVEQAMVVGYLLPAVLMTVTVKFSSELLPLQLEWIDEGLQLASEVVA
jgi:hypothetical protein